MVQYSDFLRNQMCKVHPPHNPWFRKPKLNSRKQVVSLSLQPWMPVEARLQETDIMSIYQNSDCSKRATQTRKTRKHGQVFVFSQGVEDRLFWENNWTSFSNKCVLSIKAWNKIFYLKKEEKKKIRYNQKLKPNYTVEQSCPDCWGQWQTNSPFACFQYPKYTYLCSWNCFGNTQYTITITVTELISCI